MLLVAYCCRCCLLGKFNGSCCRSSCCFRLIMTFKASVWVSITDFIILSFDKSNFCRNRMFSCRILMLLFYVFPFWSLSLLMTRQTNQPCSLTLKCHSLCNLLMERTLIVIKVFVLKFIKPVWWIFVSRRVCRSAWIDGI